MINPVCIFIDKGYSTGNSAPVISHGGCASEQVFNDLSACLMTFD